MWPLTGLTRSSTTSVLTAAAAFQLAARRVTAVAGTSVSVEQLLWEGSGFTLDLLFQFYYFINNYLSFFPL